MSASRTPTDATDLHAYYRRRIEPLADRLLDVAEDLFGEKSIQQRREFEDLVESRLHNGAKFIPRKRQPR